MKIIQSRDRGLSKTAWLHSQHSFSFGDYLNPDLRNFSVLRVINEDRVIAGAGFPAHSHKDMEIISLVREGVLEHKDSLGTHSRIHPGEIQIMSAGQGITHSEWNPDPKNEVHFLQIWIMPAQKNLQPGYAQVRYTDPKEGPALLAAPTPQANTVPVHQDMRLWLISGEKPEMKSLGLKSDRPLFIQILEGEVTVGGHALKRGDGVGLNGAKEWAQTEISNSALFLLFDLPSV